MARCGEGPFDPREMRYSVPEDAHDRPQLDIAAATRRSLKAGHVHISDALSEPLLAEDSVLELVGLYLIGAHHPQPGRAALTLASRAGIRHGDPVGHMSARERMHVISGCQEMSAGASRAMSASR